MKKALWLFVLLSVLATVLTSCSNLKNEIVGQWECEVPGEIIYTYDFKGDGTGNYTENSDEYSFSYKVRANKVTISLDGGTDSYVLEYENEKLIHTKREMEFIFVKMDLKN